MLDIFTALQASSYLAPQVELHNVRLSNGSDERMYAEQWLDRAYGMDRVDVFALEADDAERLERQNDYDDLATLLDDYVTSGGTVRDLLKAVERVVETQENKE